MRGCAGRWRGSCAGDRCRPARCRWERQQVSIVLWCRSYLGSDEDRASSESSQLKVTISNWPKFLLENQVQHQQTHALISASGCLQSLCTYLWSFAVLGTYDERACDRVLIEVGSRARRLKALDAANALVALARMWPPHVEALHGAGTLLLYCYFCHQKWPPM